MYIVSIVVISVPEKRSNAKKRFRVDLNKKQWKFRKHSRKMHLVNAIPFKLICLIVMNY